MKLFWYLPSFFLFGPVTIAAVENPHYLSEQETAEIKITERLALSPAVGDSTDVVDVAYFWSERSLLLTRRGLEAAQDDVYAAKDVWLRFSPILEKGKQLGDVQKQRLFDLMTKSVNDVSGLVAPIKLDPPVGRQRPFIRFSDSPTCLEPNDLVSGHKENDYKYRLRETGSYPSTHASVGILWASVLAELYPQYKEDLLEKGISFGESRAICGFHFESDVSAGRVAGEVLFSKLRANKQFARDLQQIKHQLEASRP